MDDQKLGNPDTEGASADRAPDELRELFAGLEPEAPSARSDSIVLAAARRVARASAWRRRAAHVLRIAAALVVAGLAVTLTLAFLGDPSVDESLTAPREASAEEEDVEVLLGRLRTELEQMGEMSELIDSELLGDREEIDARLRACLDRLETIEKSIANEAPPSDAPSDGTG